MSIAQTRVSRKAPTHTIFLKNPLSGYSRPNGIPLFFDVTPGFDAARPAEIARAPLAPSSTRLARHSGPIQAVGDRVCAR